MRVFALFGRPEVLRRFHGYATLLWILMIIPGVVSWRNSVPFLVFVSIYANVMGHWSSWQAARVEVKQDDEIDTMQQQERK